jgi:uncharacterized YigZ family protein
MASNDQYYTVEQAAEGIYRDKGSRFIGYAYPINSEAEIKDILADLRGSHPKARHFCWAYRLGPDKTVFRLNDDGEPGGSAGRPILNTILSAELTNILVVVVRYFGGTLLGVPGLINAYKTATAEALNNCNIVERTVNDVYLVSFSYSRTNSVMKIIKEERLTILDQRFDTESKLRIEIPQSRAAKILSKLNGIGGLVSTYVKTN